MNPFKRQRTRPDRPTFPSSLDGGPEGFLEELGLDLDDEYVDDDMNKAVASGRDVIRRELEGLNEFRPAESFARMHDGQRPDGQRPDENDKKHSEGSHNGDADRPRRQPRLSDVADGELEQFDNEEYVLLNPSDHRFPAPSEKDEWCFMFARRSSSDDSNSDVNRKRIQDILEHEYPRVGDYDVCNLIQECYNALIRPYIPEQPEWTLNSIRNWVHTQAAPHQQRKQLSNSMYKIAQVLQDKIFSKNATTGKVSANPDEFRMLKDCIQTFHRLRD